MLKNKKGDVFQDVFMWVFATFAYFLFGYDILHAIVEEVFLSGNPTGMMYYFGIIVPFVPIIVLMISGYMIANSNQQEAGGGL